MNTLIRHFFYIVLLSFGFYSSLTSAASEQKRIVMVLSGYGQPDGKAPGYEFDEFSKAYLLFKQHGLAIDIASPQGGAVVADKYDVNTPFNQAVLANEQVVNKLANTKSISSLSAKDYQGIFIVGGKGAMFDLPNHLDLQALIANVYQQQGVIAAVCHGPAALVNVRLADGRYLVANKKVNAMTNLEEKIFAKKWLDHFDFMLEDKLVERGGLFQSSPMMLSHVAVDQRLITGQNPASTVNVAAALVKNLGIELLPMPEYKDDRTLAMIAAYLKGDRTVLKTLNNRHDLYQLELVSAYGFYHLNIADTQDTLRQALELMLLGEQQINQSRLTLTIAQTQQKLGDILAAKATLRRLLTKDPDNQEAQGLLKRLSQTL